VSEMDGAPPRIKFYGLNDMATGWHVRGVAELVERFDPDIGSRSIDDILELHNVQQYLEHGFLPNAYTDEQRNRAQARIPQIRIAIARFFSTVDDANFAAVVAGVGAEYLGDLLDLLGRYKVFERCEGGTVLPALNAAGAHLGDLLANKKLVKAYDAEMRETLRATPQGAEHIVRKYLQEDVREDIHLPPSFTPVDARELLESYVDSVDANPNYIGLIATARENFEAGINPRLKLRAKRRSDAMNAEFFKENDGIKSGWEVGISDNQDEPAVFKLDKTAGLVSRFTYSRRWLEDTLDNPSVLNNFAHLFGFVDRHMMLIMPSYPAQLSVMERLMGTTGKNEYRIGAAFRAIDVSTRLQMRLYYSFLESEDIDLEGVISWFFEQYLVEEFGAKHFSFTPSGKQTSNLQKARHLFVEMESVANQFALFVNDGELDRDLLAMGSEQVRYKDIPSHLEGKYVYPSCGQEITGVLNLLFSDQSPLHYINENLKSKNASRLLMENRVAYGDFEEYQKPSVDYLINLGVLEDTGARVQFVRNEQFLILHALSTTQAANYFHLSGTARALVDAMAVKGWVTRRSSLLTEAEGKYFNYYLNAVDFSNGPELRNKYLHGSQPIEEGEDAHLDTYVTALRLTVALVIKINDDFCLSAPKVENQR
jgi:hypothetical protein